MVISQNLFFRCHTPQIFDFLELKVNEPFHFVCVCVWGEGDAYQDMYEQAPANLRNVAIFFSAPELFEAIMYFIFSMFK
jgi:hypothetical protein